MDLGQETDIDFGSKEIADGRSQALDRWLR
jgi:hypothetical protein